MAIQFNNGDHVELPVKNMDTFSVGKWFSIDGRLNYYFVTCYPFKLLGLHICWITKVYLNNKLVEKRYRKIDFHKAVDIVNKHLYGNFEFNLSAWDKALDLRYAEIERLSGPLKIFPENLIGYWTLDSDVGSSLKTGEIYEARRIVSAYIIAGSKCLTYEFKGIRRMIRELDFKERYVKKDCAGNIVVDLSGNDNYGKPCN